MKFGLFGSAAARRGSPEFDSSEGFRDFIDYNIEAEALGFDSTFVVEHHFTGFGQVSATLNLLTWLGARTSQLRLGTAVTVLPWHNPVLLAEQAATLDLLSGGRLDFGIGKGYRYNEFAGFCVPIEEAEARFEESIDVIVKSWTASEPFSHRGTYWSFEKIVVEPPTAQKPHPPIWMGAGGERSIRQVAAKGYNLLLGQYAGPEDVGQSIAIFKDAVEASGRHFDTMQVGVSRAFFVADGPDDNIRKALYGSPEEIAQQLQALRAVGAGYILINGGGSGGGARGLCGAPSSACAHLDGSRNALGP